MNSRNPLTTPQRAIGILNGMCTPTPLRSRSQQLTSTTKSNIIELPARLNPLRPVINPGRFPCQELGPDLWFSVVPAELNLAKQYCQGCSNRRPCLAGALKRGEPTGVWGGEIFERGRIIEGKRPRGRPRKQTFVEEGAEAS